MRTSPSLQDAVTEAWTAIFSRLLMKRNHIQLHCGVAKKTRHISKIYSIAAAIQSKSLHILSRSIYWLCNTEIAEIGIFAESLCCLAYPYLLSMPLLKNLLFFKPVYSCYSYLATATNVKFFLCFFWTPNFANAATLHPVIFWHLLVASKLYFFIICLNAFATS